MCPQGSWNSWNSWSNTSADEFENRALIFHILIDLREFLEYKINFVENLDEEQRRRYWNA